MDKDNFEKNHKKITWENTATIHSVLKKKNNKAKFLINSILKKINRDNFRKKNNKTNTKKIGKNHVGNTVAIHSVL
jgi:gluconate kinase